MLQAGPGAGWDALNSCRRSSAQREIQQASDDPDSEDDPRYRWRFKPCLAECCIERITTGARESESDSNRREHERVLDPVGRDEELVLAMNRDHGDDHPGDHQRGPDRTEKPQREQQSAEKLTESSSGRERLAGTESKRLQETAGSSDSITAKPAEQLLRAVSGVDESEDHAHNEETQIQQLRIDCYSRRHEISANVDA